MHIRMMNDTEMKTINVKGKEKIAYILKEVIHDIKLL